MAKASASYTIMDYTDGVTLLGAIEANLPRTVLYDTTTQKCNPSWADTSLQLTPKITKAGGTTDLVSSLKSSDWYRREAGGAWVKVVSGSNDETINGTTKVLSVSKDKMTGNIWQIEYKFVATYSDPVILLDLDYEMVITFSRVANGTSFVLARAYAPGGDMFKNGLPATLSIVAELIRGTKHDTTDLTYTWEKSTNGSTWAVMSGKTTATITINADDVDSFAMFRVKIKDTDAQSETYNDTFISEGVTIIDVSDPYQVVIQSSAGQFFKNNTGSTVLTARVYRDGEEVDVAGSSLTYSWTMTDKDGANVSSVGGVTFPKSGKNLTVTHDMVNIKGTFFCEIS